MQGAKLLLFGGTTFIVLIIINPTLLGLLQETCQPFFIFEVLGYGENYVQEHEPGPDEKPCLDKLSPSSDSQLLPYQGLYLFYA